MPPRSQHVNRFLLTVGLLVVIAAEPARAATVSVTVTQHDRLTTTDTIAAASRADVRLTPAGRRLLRRRPRVALTIRFAGTRWRSSVATTSR